MFTSRNRRRFAVAGLVVGAVVTQSVGTASAVHWPLFGGDAGRSGYQSVDEGIGPIRFQYSATGPSDQNIVTSITTSALQPSTQRIIYGTADGRIHLRILATGAEVGPAGGVDVSDEVDAFGDGAVGSVSFAETSSGAGLGQVFAVHNGANGIEIAQVDETTGTLVQDVAVAGAAGYTISSSPLITGAAADGSRALLFVAEHDTNGEQRLFRVRVTSPATTSAVIEAATSTADINATPEASPTLAFLAPGSAFVLVGTLDGKVLSFAAGTLAAGPGATVGGASDEVQTPSVPVTPSGNPPGAAGSGVDRAPVAYVASRVDGNQNTKLHRLTFADAATPFAVASSATLAGAAAPALATDQEVESTLEVGAVFVSTESNLYSVRTNDLVVTAKLSPTDSLEGGLNGFSATTAAASGDLVFIAQDNGQQLVLRAGSLQPVAGSQFTQSAANTGSVTSIGQPSISRRFLQLASDRGLFVYRLTIATSGYRTVARDGGVFAFGGAAFLGSAGNLTLNQPVVGMADTPTGNGYWLVASDGGVFAYGDARFLGSTGNIKLNQPIVAIIATPTGNGYWLVASDGGVFAYGDAPFVGSTGNITLNRPIVGAAPTSTGNGYWLVASDGGVFAFGDAVFAGSTGNITLNQPVVGMAARPGGGYWLVASDGGVFAFGGAPFYGSTGNIRLNQPVVGIVSTPSGNGYIFTAADGGIFVFGDGSFFGSTGSITLNQPVVGISVTP